MAARGFGVGKPSPASSHTAVAGQLSLGYRSLVEQLAGGQRDWSGGQEIGARPTMRLVYRQYCLALASSQGVGRYHCERGRVHGSSTWLVVLMLPCFLVPRSAPLLPQPAVTKMPILEKAPPKMAAKTPSSEEEPVSDFWSPLSYPCSPHSHALASRTVLGGTGPQTSIVLGMRPRQQGLMGLLRSLGGPGAGDWKWLQGVLCKC